MRYALLVVYATKEEDNFSFILRRSVNCSAKHELSQWINYLFTCWKTNETRTATATLPRMHSGIGSLSCCISFSRHDAISSIQIHTSS